MRLALPLLLLALALAGCQKSAPVEQTVAKNEGPPPEVRVTTPKEQVWPRTIRVQGNLIGDEAAVLGTKVGGLVMAVHVDLGQTVKTGEPLADLDVETVKLQVQQATAELESLRAKLGLKPEDPDEKLDPLKAPSVQQEAALRREAIANRDRGRELRTRNVMTAAEFLTLEAAVEVAEARFNSAVNSVREQMALLRVRRTELARANQVVKDSVVRAPFDGVIERRYVAPGVYLQVGEPVVTLVRTDPIRFQAGVPEREMARVARDQRVTIVIDPRTSPIETRITRMSPSLNPSNRSLTIEADIPNPDGVLRPGGFAEAEIEVDPEARTLVVPATAIVEFAGLEKVWVIKNGEAAEVQVTTGRRDARVVEILDGVEPGQQIAAEATEARAGPVQIANAGGPGNHVAD